ncbi:MAG: hypothetical protein Alis3KO_00640 [Aliiglaciecola sp.]
MVVKSLSQRCWEWIEQQPDFQVKDLVVEMEQPTKTIRSIVDEFVRKGAVKGRKTARLASLYERTGENPPSFSRERKNPHSENNSRQRIWSAIKFYRTFTIDDVVSTTSVSRGSVNRYISELCKYGYVARTRKQRGGNKSQRGFTKCKYLLLEDTGRKYPVIRKTGLWDQNKQLLVPNPSRKESKK